MLYTILCTRNFKGYLHTLYNFVQESWHIMTLIHSMNIEILH